MNSKVTVFKILFYCFGIFYVCDYVNDIIEMIEGEISACLLFELREHREDTKENGDKDLTSF
jgi:hypothetical protein